MDGDNHAFADPAVEAVFSGYSDSVRTSLLALRAAIFRVAAEEQIAPLEETLKWGQPSYLTPGKTGTTIRIDADASHGGELALYVNCHTTLVDEWRDRFPELIFSGTRSVHFRAGDDFCTPAVTTCIAMALNYHRAKKRLSSAQFE